MKDFGGTTLRFMMAAEGLVYMETEKKGHVRYNLGEANVSGVWHHLLMSKQYVSQETAEKLFRGEIRNG